MQAGGAVIDDGHLCQNKMMRVYIGETRMYTRIDHKNDYNVCLSAL